MIPTINMAATGENIKKLIENSNFTVKELQMIFGFAAPQAIYKWQRGETMPTVDNLVALAAVLGVTMDEIIVTDTAAKAQNNI